MVPLHALLEGGALGKIKLARKATGAQAAKSKPHVQAKISIYVLRGVARCRGCSVCGRWKAAAYSTQAGLITPSTVGMTRLISFVSK